MMASKSQVFTNSGTFNVPANISCVFVTATAGGAGGGGGYGGGSADWCASAGGSAEMCMRVPLQVTPGGTLPVTIGGAGTAGIKSNTGTPTSGGNGGDTQVGWIIVRGGKGGGHANPSAEPSSGGNGGGVGGGAGAAGNGTPGHDGVGEAPLFFGGSGGGGNSSSTGSAGGPFAPFSGGVGHLIGSGGSGGGSSLWGQGGTGGTANLGGAPNGQPPSTTAYGGGGGGAGGGSISGTSFNGGPGASGYVLLEWQGP